MAVDIFIEFPGTATLAGETQDKVKGPKGGIDVLAWSWGLSQSGTFHSGSGGGAGKVNVQDLSFTKYVDASSAGFQSACCTGAHIPNATLTVRKAGTTPLEYIVIHMKKILVSSISLGGSGGEDRLTENVTLNFAEVDFNYLIQDPATGAAKGAAKYNKWDIEKNAPAT